MILRAFAAVVVTAALSAAETAQSVLARMDQEAAGFHQITAKVKKTEFTAVLNDSSSESGQMWLERAGRGIVMRAEFAQPNARTVGVSANQAEIYQPKTNSVDIYNLGKFGALADQFLVLGFGTSGKEISKNYNVSLKGEETINGTKTAHLELVPKSAKVLEQISKVDLWIPQNAGHPVQQKVVQKNGDYYLVTYSDIKLNPNLPDSAFQVKLPAGVEKRFPQK